MSQLPMILKVTNIRPILKKKQDKTDVLNYRPFSLASTCAEVMGMIIAKQFRSFLLAGNVTPKS